MKLIDRADEMMSKYIRLRDCGYGYGRCISCGKAISFLSSQCGHFIPRQHKSVRFDEDNCHAQCVECNEHKHGNIKAYRKNLERKIGANRVERLESLKHEVKMLRDSDLRQIIQSYRDKIKDYDGT